MSQLILRPRGPESNDPPVIYRTSKVISNDMATLIGPESSPITSIGVYESNLYVGTKNGTIKHYHLFEDAPEYMLISEVPVSSNPVQKILVLVDVERALILSGGVATVYSLPELSPVNMGKLKEVNDVQVFESADEDDGTGVNVLVLAATKIRIVKVGRDLLKLVSDLNYSNAVTGVPIKTSNSNSSSSSSRSLALVANRKNYDIIDLKQIRKIPLFEYTQETDGDSNEEVPVPHIIPFTEDERKGKEEYMLSIQSDKHTSIAMFIDSRGNVTRGTLPWLEAGNPDSLVIEWPYIVGIFKDDKLIVNSLKNLDVEYEGSVTELINGQNKNQVEGDEELQGSKDEAELQRVPDLVAPLEVPVETKSVEVVSNAQENTKRSSKETEDSDTLGIIPLIDEVSNTEDSSKESKETEGSETRDANPHIDVDSNTEDGSKETKDSEGTKAISNSEDSPEEIKEDKDPNDTESVPNSENSSKETEDVSKTEDKETEVSKITIDNSTEELTSSKADAAGGEISSGSNFKNQNESDGKLTGEVLPIPITTHMIKLSFPVKIVDNILLQSIAMVDSSGTQISPNNISAQTPMVASSILIYDESQVWIFHRESTLAYVESQIMEIIDEKKKDTIKDRARILFNILEKDDNVYEKEVLQFKIQLKFIVSLLLQDDLLALSILLNEEFDDKNLIFDPKLVLFLLDKSPKIDYSDILFFASVSKIITKLEITSNKAKYQTLLGQYIKELYIRLIKDYSSGREVDLTLVSNLRIKLYIRDVTLKTSKKIIEFIDKYDRDMFIKNETQDSSNKAIRLHLDKNRNYLALIHVYKVSLASLKPTAKSIIAEEICRIILKLLNKSSVDKDLDYDVDSSHLVDTYLLQLASIYNEKVYATYLLEILKFDPEKGLSFMRKNNSIKYKDIHRRIMSEISSNSSPEISKLKIEYLESTIQDIHPQSGYDQSAIDDLMAELCHRGEALAVDTNINNFMVLQETYKLENRLNDPEWPKVSWIDYLRVNMERSECKEFAENYLKIVDLLLARSDGGNSYKDNSNISSLIEQQPSIYAFYNLVFDMKVEKLLEASDYSTAEYFSIHGRLPPPSKPYYFKDDFRQPQNISTEDKKSNLKVVLQFYTTGNESFAAIRHFIRSYGSEYFTMLEILSLLPSYIPVVQIQEYLADCLIKLGSEHRDALVTKIVSRSLEKNRKKLLKQFQTELLDE